MPHLGRILIMAKVKFHKGLKANLPSEGLAEGHYYQCVDTGELYLATSSTTLVPVGAGGSGLPLSVVDGKLCITFNQ